MLKEKGKEGEEVLHYNGFLDGWGCGFGVGKDYAINKACKWLKKNLPITQKEDAENMKCKIILPENLDVMITEFRKAMGE